MSYRMSHILCFPDYFIVMLLAYFFIPDISSKLEAKYKSLIQFYINVLQVHFMGDR